MLNAESLRFLANDIADFIAKNYDCVFATKVQTELLKDLMPASPFKEGPLFNKLRKDFEKDILPAILKYNGQKTTNQSTTENLLSLIFTKILCLAQAIEILKAPCVAAPELETLILDYYAKALHLPEALSGGGTLQSSTSECVLTSLLAARAQIIESLRGNSSGTHDSIYLPQLTAYASKAAHAGVKKATVISLVKLRTIETDHKGRLRGDLLLEAIHNDMQAGLTPFFVVAMAGTAETTDFDEILTIGKICKSFPNVWLHVDGSYAGNLLLLPELQMLTRGFEYIDSFNTDPNQLFLTKFDFSTLWMRKENAKYGFKEDLRYLNEATEQNLHLKALSLWFVFRTCGISNIQSYVRKHFVSNTNVKTWLNESEGFVKD